MTILGRTLSRPGDEIVRHLAHAEAATATAISAFWTNDEFDSILVHVYDVERPVSHQVGDIVVSTNGATFETGAAYQWSAMGNSATTAAGATGVTADGRIGMFIAGGGFALATSTTFPGEAFIRVMRPVNAKMCHVQFEWHFLNSASVPAHCHGHGYFATGPCRGLQVDFGAVNFSAKADVYGFGKRRV